MTNPIEPATDERVPLIDRLVDDVRAGILIEPYQGNNNRIGAKAQEALTMLAQTALDLVAELGAVRDAYAERSRHDARLIDAEKARAEKAEAERDALRAACEAALEKFVSFTDDGATSPTRRKLLAAIKKARGEP